MTLFERVSAFRERFPNPAAWPWLTRERDHDVLYAIGAARRGDGMRLNDAPRQPCFARCGACGHIWAFAYIPMELATFARTMKRATCPMCGMTGKRLYIAKQDTRVVERQP